jgi:flagellar hook-associated protein 1
MAGVNSAAISSMDRSKLEFAIAAQNIANANEPDYSRIKINVSPSIVNGHPMGVEIESLSTFVDESMQNSLLKRVSDSTYFDTIKEYMQKSNDLFGSPDNAFGIDAKFNQAFAALEDLSRNPSSATLKLLAINSLDSLSTDISNTAYSLHQLRQQADIEIANSISTVNHILEKIFVTVGTINALKDGSLERVNAEETLRGFFQNLSEYFEIQKLTSGNTGYQIFTKEGDALITDVVSYFKYTPLGDMHDYIYDTEFNTIYSTILDGAGNDMGINIQVVKGGTSDQVINKYSSGKIGALLQLRDTELPKILAQLDNFAYNITEEFNKIHNNAAGFPPPVELNGTNAVSRNQLLGFSGKTRITIVDDNGKMLSNLPDFCLDFNKLDSGVGAGLANTQAIINEINYHFGQKIAQNKSITLGNLSNIALVSKTKDITPSSIWDFAIELDNFSQTDSNFQIISATATDSLANNVLGTTNTSISVASKGAITQTDNGTTGFSLNLPAAINTPITIQLQVSVDDGTATTISNLEYEINIIAGEPINGALNTRYAIKQKVNAVDPGTVNVAAFNGGVMSATIVDELGNDLALNSTKNGYIKLQSANSSYHIVIDSLDSSQNGNPVDNILGTKESFSYFFGLNDLFVRNDNKEYWNQKKNTAVSFALREDVKMNPSYLARTRITKDLDYTDTSTELFTYHISEGDNSALTDMVALTNKNIIFSEAGSLSATQVTLFDYLANIIAFNSAQASKAISQSNESNLLKTAVANQLRNLKGVDINQELTNLVLFQQSFAAAAKALKAGNDLYDILFEVI